MAGAIPSISRPIAKRASPATNGRTRPPRSISPPTTTIPTSDPRKKAEKTQPYSSIPERSRLTIGMIVETASDSKATSVIVRTSPIVSRRRAGDQRPSFGSP